jgi:hypothetical protein
LSGRLPDGDSLGIMGMVNVPVPQGVPQRHAIESLERPRPPLRVGEDPRKHRIILEGTSHGERGSIEEPWCHPLNGIHA